MTADPLHEYTKFFLEKQIGYAKSDLKEEKAAVKQCEQELEWHRKKVDACKEKIKMLQDQRAQQENVS